MTLLILCDWLTSPLRPRDLLENFLEYFGLVESNQTIAHNRNISLTTRPSEYVCCCLIKCFFNKKDISFVDNKYSKYCFLMKRQTPHSMFYLLIINCFQPLRLLKNRNFHLIFKKIRNPRQN